MADRKTPKLSDVLRKSREFHSASIKNRKVKFPSQGNEGITKNINDYFKYNDVITGFIRYLNEERRTGEEIKQYIILHFIPIHDNYVRHSYFQISATLQEIRNKEAADASILQYNLNLLIEQVINDREIRPVRDKLFKFYDHCQLEIGRFNYFDSAFWKSDDAKNKYESVTMEFNRTKADVENKLESVNNQTNNLKKVIESSKSEHITILSIFAAIVLASLGGLSFLSSVLKGINEASIFRLVMISSICGFVLFNTLFMLLYIASRIIGRSIYTFCAEANDGADCTNENKKCSKNCCGITRVRNRLPYVFWVNVIFLTFMVVDVFAWIVLRTKVFEPVPIFLICIKESIVSLLF